MKKFLSLLLCALILMSTLCVSSFAEGEAARGECEPFRIHLSVNGDAKTQKGLSWYTTSNTTSLVEVYDADMNKSSAKITYEDVFEWEGNFCHKAVISGLEAGKTYFYTVGDDAVRSDIGTFVTDDGDDKTEFVAIADIQAGSLNNFLKGRRTLDAAYKTLPNAEFYINLGDFTNDSTNEEWDYYDEAVTSFNLNTTIAPVAGNHDGLGVWNWFNNMFCVDTSESVQTLNGFNYSFDYGNVHISVLNTNDMLTTSLAQLKWLRNDLNSTDKDWKIVAIHKSPYTLGKDGKWPDALYLQRSLTAVCDMCDVDLVISGHDHQYVRTKSLKGNKVVDDGEGTVYALCGTAGSKRYDIRPFSKQIFMKDEFIAGINIQRNTDWDGKSWYSNDVNLEEITHIGGEFNTITTDGGTLTFKSYVASDAQEDENGNPIESEAEVTLVDEFTLTKETGKNEITYTGDNTTSKFEYYMGVIPSFICLAIYTFGEWLPKFLFNIPNLAYVFIKYDIF